LGTADSASQAAASAIQPAGKDENAMLNTFIAFHYRPEVRGGRIRQVRPDREEKTIARPNRAAQSIPSLILGPKSDAVVQLLEKRLSVHSQVQILYYEDMGSKWGYLFDGERIEFFHENEVWEPKLIYVRGAAIEPEHALWKQMANLFEVLNCSPTEVLGRPERQTLNESKLFQLIHSLKAAAATSEGEVNIGQSYVLKGDPSRLAILLGEVPNLIVKSLSGIRSKVVNQAVFSSWSKEPLSSLPVLFQKQVHGSDARVHFLAKGLWALKVQDKTEVDYRYAPSHSEMREFQATKRLQMFCEKVSELERNPLLGLDFIIRADGGFTVLEANPGPGWAWYHENELCSKSFPDTFIKILEAGIIE
jgi:hypothetical protein